MGPADRGVHADLPADPACRVRRGLQLGHHPRPGAVPLPAAEQPVNRLPPAITPWHIPPRRTRPRPPPDPVDQLPRAAGPACPRPGGRGSTRSRSAHCSSVRSPRPTPRSSHASPHQDQLMKHALAVPAPGEPARPRSAPPHQGLVPPAYRTRYPVTRLGSRCGHFRRRGAGVPRVPGPCRDAAEASFSNRHSRRSRPSLTPGFLAQFGGGV